MLDGFIKVASASVETFVGNPAKNAENIIKAVKQADNSGVKLLCFAELSVTGIDCGSLFFSDVLLKKAKAALFQIISKTADTDVMFVVGLPVKISSKIYNCAAVIQKGELFALIPSREDSPYFAKFESEKGVHLYDFIESADGYTGSIPFTDKIIFSCKSCENYKFGVVFGYNGKKTEELCKKGAKIILSLSSYPETVTSRDNKNTFYKCLSAKQICSVVCAECDETESTAKAVYSANHMIYECGTRLAENAPFEGEKLLISEVDVNKIANLRSCDKSYNEDPSLYFKDAGVYDEFEFVQDITVTALSRHIDKNPFMPDTCNEAKRTEHITKIQAYGLKKRMTASKSRKMVIGISGGLDSTLALLICVKAADLLGYDRKCVIAVTMPCFGTSERTKSNAVVLCEKLGVDLRKIDITEAVRLHFKDISHDEDIKNAAYENAQARERTQVLMDIANDEGGLVIGTGDLSESALGWCTYNGDHMSMYGVNCSVPKTLMRKVVENEAKNCPDKSLSDTLFDILNTPVSPELMPPEDGKIAQYTEEIIGPYALHDFFIYYTVKYGFTNEKLQRLAEYAFAGEYSREDIEKCFSVFKRRFATQQFKRSCAPDGVIIGSVNLSNYGGFSMPSDVDGDIFS